MSLAFFTQIKVNIVCQQHGQYKYISVVTAFIICLNMAFLNFISQNVGNNKVLFTTQQTIYSTITKNYKNSYCLFWISLLLQSFQRSVCTWVWTYHYGSLNNTLVVWWNSSGNPLSIELQLFCKKEYIEKPISLPGSTSILKMVFKRGPWLLWFYKFH